MTSNTTTNGQTQSVDNGWTADGWTKNSSTWSPGTNHVVFRSIVSNGAGKIAITMTADPGDGSRNPKLMVSGFQLVDRTPVPPALSLTNAPATGVTAESAVLNATLRSTGTLYQVSAFWNTVNGGTNAALWTNSAYVGAWTNLTATNLSFTATGLAPNKTYYFTFRATNTVDTMWATNVQSFTTVPLIPPTPVLPLGQVSVSNGVPTFTFAGVAGFKYRLVRNNNLTNSIWLPVIAPPNFPPPDGWSVISTGAPMSLSDTNTPVSPQRFYRLEAAHPSPEKIIARLNGGAGSASEGL